MQPHFAYQRELCAKNCTLQINLDMYVVQCAYPTPTPLTFIVGSWIFLYKNIHACAVTFLPPASHLSRIGRGSFTEHLYICTIYVHTFQFIYNILVQYCIHLCTFIKNVQYSTVVYGKAFVGTVIKCLFSHYWGIFKVFLTQQKSSCSLEKKCREIVFVCFLRISWLVRKCLFSYFAKRKSNFF